MEVGDLITQYFEMSRMTAKRRLAGWGIILRIAQPSAFNREYEVLWPDGVISMINERDALSYEEYLGNQVLNAIAKKVGSDR